MLFASVFIWCGQTLAQSAKQEPAAILELGAAAGRSLTAHASSIGPDLAIEITPIEKWLELEMGTTPLFTHNSLEWDTDLLFKKPWTLSPKVEFMMGAGPEWIHTRENETRTNALGGEVVLDFMFWPSAKYNLGWFVEPSYEYRFGREHEHSIGISGGLLIAIERKRLNFGRR